MARLSYWNIYQSHIMGCQCEVCSEVREAYKEWDCTIAPPGPYVHYRRLAAPEGIKETNKKTPAWEAYEETNNKKAAARKAYEEAEATARRPGRE